MDQNYMTKFHVFSVRAPNCVRLQLVEVRDNRLTVSPIAQFYINDGRVTGFDIHPSKDYVLITSNKGKVYLFRIETGELRGTIKVPNHAQGCLIDPSGLYVVVQVPPHSALWTRGAHEQGNSSHLGTNEKDLSRTTIMVYEIGTGAQATEVRSIFDIREMQFSSDGRYLALGSQRGSVSVFALGDHLYQHVSEVIREMKAQPDFWHNFPLFLPDHASYGQGSINQQHPVLQEQQPPLHQLYMPDQQQSLSQ